MKDVSKRIRELRQEKGMTQEELAERLHVTRQAVSNWETRKTRPDVEMLEAISAVFGIELMEFLYGKPGREAEQRNLRWAVVFGGMTVLGMLLKLFVAPIITVMAERTYNMAGVLVLSVVIRVLQGAAVPLVLSLLSLWKDVAVENVSVRRLLLVLGIVPVALVTAWAIMAAALSGQSGSGVPEWYFNVYMGLFAVAANKYMPVVAGGLLYLGIKKPKQKGEDL